MSVQRTQNSRSTTSVASKVITGLPSRCLCAYICTVNCMTNLRFLFVCESARARVCMCVCVCVCVCARVRIRPIRLLLLLLLLSLSVCLSVALSLSLSLSLSLLLARSLSVFLPIQHTPLIEKSRGAKFLLYYYRFFL